MKTDIVIIGSGPGGYVAAIRAKQLGMDVVIVEKAELGGVCLNWGCIPTKALLKSAKIYQNAIHAENFGIDIEGSVKPNFQKIIERSRDVASTMNKGVQFLLDKNGITIVKGQGRIAAQGRVEVETADGNHIETIETSHIIIATGARPLELPFMKFNPGYVISSREALILPKQPESIVIVGSGAIGCEFACFFAELGTKVTIIEYMGTLLPSCDEEVSKQLERSFRKARINTLTSTAVKNVEIIDGKCNVQIESKKGIQTITAEMVLSAVGIKSNIENLGLEQLGIETERDKIKVNQWYETSVPGIYAIGDVVHGPALAHVASAEGICCVEKIAGINTKPIDYYNIPSCVYTSPEIASVGMTEKEAIEKGYTIKTGKFPYTASGKATASGERDGFVKLVIDADNDTVLGAHLIGANVTEMISETTLARTLNGKTADIINTIHPHPTMNEAIMEAAEAAHGNSIHLVI